jgi:hypothetical protein
VTFYEDDILAFLLMPLPGQDNSLSPRPMSSGPVSFLLGKMNPAARSSKLFHLRLFSFPDKVSLAENVLDKIFFACFAEISSVLLHLINEVSKFPVIH